MDRGLQISLFLHALLLGVALLGVDFFQPKDETPLEVTTVDFVDPSAFVSDTAPEALKEEDLQAEALAPPEPTELPQETLAPPEMPALPSLVENIGISDDVGVASDFEQLGTIDLDVPDLSAAPLDAEKVTGEDQLARDPTPLEDLNPIDEPVEISEPTPPEEEEEEESAPQEATASNILSEAERSDIINAPIKTVIPKGRPQNLEAASNDTSDDAKINEAPSIEDLITQDIETREDAPAPELSLTGQEISQLVFSVQSCWKLPIGLANARELKVVVRFQLDQSGFVISEPRLIEPSDLSGGIQQAFEAARNAIIACQPYSLPVEKYDSWRELEVLFNPEKMIRQ